jgi:hypothetical protein
MGVLPTSSYNERTSRTNPSLRPSRGPSLVVVATGVAFLVAACGSSKLPNRSPAAVPSGEVAFAACMRSHGVPGLPDPGPNGLNLSGIDTQSPAFRSAHEACAPLQSPSTAPGSPASDGQRLAALANARCMRSHGVPNFPDPQFLPNGGNTIMLNGINTKSPAFKRAQAACPWPPRD